MRPTNDIRDRKTRSSDSDNTNSRLENDKKTPRVLLSSTSATGNPRNKTALAPGHSLMDWIRLGNSGVDLSGTKGKIIRVNKAELCKHASADDLWLAIRGQVFNVTRYLSFHPGGHEELMRGAGKDATALFDAAHAWVNYQTILQKCVIGPLVSDIPSPLDELNFSSKNMLRRPRLPQVDYLPKPKLSQNISNNLSANEKQYGEETNKVNKNIDPIEKLDGSLINSSTQNFKNTKQYPRFDWMQTQSWITFVFYTAKFSNPYICANMSSCNNLVITLQYAKEYFKYTLHSLYEVKFPCKVIVTHHTGKIELKCLKVKEGMWENFGKLSKVDVSQEFEEFDNYTIVQQEKVGRNTYIMTLENHNIAGLHLPLGGHVIMKIDKPGIVVERCYTPINISYTSSPTKNALFSLLIKLYPKGELTSKLYDVTIPLPVLIKPSVQTFDLKSLEGHSDFLFLAGGTGITPFLNLIIYLLDRKSYGTKSILLVYYNKEEEDILIRNKLLELQQKHPRFSVTFVLTEPHAQWNGEHGRISKNSLMDLLSNRPKPTYQLICGPPQFGECAIQILEQMNFCSYYLFLG